MKIIHVTVAYNSPNDLENLFINIDLQDEETHHIICVDNSNSNYKKTNEAICRKLNLNQNFNVDYYPLKQNYGSSKGFAIGMTLGYNAGADFVWFHDQDGFPLPGCLHNIKKYLNTGLEILGPMVYYENNEYLHVFHGNYDKYLNLMPVTFNNEIASAEVAGTAGLFIGKKVFDNIGTYDYKHYFIGNEDFDYCLRARIFGFKIGIVKDALYFHPNKWGNINSQNKKNHVRYFGGISSTEMINRDAAYIHYHIKYCRQNFLLSLLYSFLIVLVYKLYSKNINLLATYKCYIHALANRYSVGNSKINIDPNQFLARVSDNNGNEH